LNFLADFFKKKGSNITFHQNSSIGADMFHAGWLAGGRANVRADGHDEASSCFSQFYEITQKYL
jgi:hypothetical protein